MCNLRPSELIINKFRNMNNVTFRLGKRITVVSGQNGVGKSSLISLIASGSGLNRNAIMGSNFQPEFYDFFNLDVSEHYTDYELFIKYVDEQTQYCVTKRLSFKDDSDTNRGIRIIPRTSNRFEEKKSIKQVEAEVKSKYGIGGAARIPIPTIYLSLSRLYPLGEKKKDTVVTQLRKSNQLYQHEANQLFMQWYNYVLPNSITELSSLYKIEKETSSRASLHMGLDHTPALSQSVGQDNLGNIISALVDIYVLSNEPTYNGALLCIDEVDVSLHPDAQKRLIGLFSKLSSDLRIQFVLTTHSLTIIRELLKMEKSNTDDFSLVYFKNPSNPYVSKQKEYELLEADLFGRTAFNMPKPKLYFEDEEGFTLFNLLLESLRFQINRYENDHTVYELFDKRHEYKKRILELKELEDFDRKVSPIPVFLGCEEFFKLVDADMYFKRVIIVLDGDARIKEPALKPKIRDYIDTDFDSSGLTERKHQPTFCFLPSFFAPESYVYKIIHTMISQEMKYQQFWRGLEEYEEVSLFTADKVKMFFNGLGNEYNNDDLKKCFKEDLRLFVDKSGFLNYYYADDSNIEELIQFFESIKKAYSIAKPLTIANRYS